MNDLSNKLEPYIPFFSHRKHGGTVTTGILKPAYLHSFETLRARFKTEENADLWLAEKLGYPDLQNSHQCLNAEQADSVLMAICALEAGKNFIIGDKTGVGKGRILAAIARYALSSNKKVLFITEKGNLFSDFWRDICDTQTDKILPKEQVLILHSSADVYRNGSLVIRKLSKSNLANIVRHKNHQDYRVILTTYTQISGKTGSERVDFLQNFVDKDTIVLLDEFHNAIGDTYEAKEKVVKNAFGVVESSATFMKELVHLKAFQKQLNLTGDLEKLFHALEVDASGFALESIATSLVASGSMLKREHQIDLTPELVEMDDDTNQKINFYLDSFAYFLKEVFQFRENCCIRLKRKPENGFKWSKWAAKIDRCAKSLLVLASVDFLCNNVLSALKENKKAAIVLKSTFSSLVEDEYKRQKRQNPNGVFNFDFNGVLHSFIEESMNDFDELKQEESFEADLKRLYSIANNFPPIELSIIDVIKRKLYVHLGYEPLEISGRINYVVRTKDKGDLLEPITYVDRNLIVEEFNNGLNDCAPKDVIILTSAGSTGISLHSSLAFKDQRVRKMFEFEITPKVVERGQFIGRFYRNNQVNTPEAELFVPEHVLGQRIIAKESHKQKTARLLTGSNYSQVLDFDNPAAEMAARNYLRHHETMANLIGLKSHKINIISNDGTLGSALLRRSFMLPKVERDVVLQLLTEATEVYQSSLADFERLIHIDLNSAQFKSAKTLYSMNLSSKGATIRELLKQLAPVLYIAQFELPVQNEGVSINQTNNQHLPPITIPDLRVFEQSDWMVIKKNAALLSKIRVGHWIEFHINGTRLIGYVNALHGNPQYPFAEQQKIEVLIHKESDTLLPISQSKMVISGLILLMNKQFALYSPKPAKNGGVLSLKRVKMEKETRIRSVILGHPLLLEWASTVLHEAGVLEGVSVGSLLVDEVLFPILHIPNSVEISSIEKIFQHQPVFNKEDLKTKIKAGYIVKTADNNFGFMWDYMKSYPYGYVRLKEGIYDDENEMPQKIKSRLGKRVKLENGFEYFKITKLSELHSIALSIFKDKYHQFLAIKRS